LVRHEMDGRPSLVSDQFEPGREGFKGKLRGPTRGGFLPNELAIAERFTDQWSRLWAISYDPAQVTPDHMTAGWWFLAEFDTRQQARDFFVSLQAVYLRASTPRRKTKTQAPNVARMACPECGARSLSRPDFTIDNDPKRLMYLRCTECGHEGPAGTFKKESAQ
jgi:DNA-directed RNA polymerase subunit RPC12/RpoP